MMGYEDLVATTFMLPLLGAAIAFCAKLVGKERKIAKVCEYGGACIGLVAPIVVLVQLLPGMLDGQVITGIIGGWSGTVGITFRFDGLAWLIDLLGYTIALAAYIYSLSSGPKGPSFTGIFLIQSAALAATIMTNDLFNLFVCLEVLGITSYVLIPTSGKPGASLAAFSYLMVSATAMVFFLVGTYGLYRITGSLSYAGIAGGLATMDPEAYGVAVMSLSVLVAAVAIRVAVMPLYGWLPDAHALAPHAISAVLSGVLIKTPLFALSRVLVLFPIGGRVGYLMGLAGGITAFLGVVLALSQSDAKRLLAYHSISQIGYVVAAWGMAAHMGIHTPEGAALMVAAYLHALFHALFKGLLFFSVGTTTDVTKVRDVLASRNSIASLRSAGERLPITFVTFLAGALSITAIPPFNGFVSKYLVGSSLKGSLVSFLLIAAGVGTVASFIKLSRIYWPMKHTFPQSVEKISFLPRHLAQLLLASLCIATGIWAPWIIGIVGKLLGGVSRLDGFSPYSPDNLIKTGSTVVGGILLFLLMGRPWVSDILHRIRDRRMDFKGLFVSFSLGTAAMALWLWV
jgi:multicomponent Na+:H+ antiporter subunit D